MRTKAKAVKAWAIQQKNGRLFTGSEFDRIMCITRFCHDLDTRSKQERADNPLPAYGWRRLGPETRKAWAYHRRLGVQCVRVQITPIPPKRKRTRK